MNEKRLLSVKTERLRKEMHKVRYLLFLVNSTFFVSFCRNMSNKETNRKCVTHYQWRRKVIN